MGMPCAPNCPACAQDEFIRGGVREIVLDMWLQAIADGDRNIESALREMQPVISKLLKLDRWRVCYEFVERALKVTPRKRKQRKTRGLPAAWHTANCDLVELVKRHENVPANHVNNSYDHDSLFRRVAEIWQGWAIDVTSRQVQDSYYENRQSA